MRLFAQLVQLSPMVQNKSLDETAVRRDALIAGCELTSRVVIT